MNTVTKLANWSPATHSDPKPDPDPLARPIDFVLTKNDRDTAAMCRLEIEAMKRHRCPDGLEVGFATQADFDEARRVLVL